jgi:hypothetical protein
MIALRRDDVADLNHRARAKMLGHGRLTGPTLDLGGVQLQTGDRIVCLRNDRRLGVVNGTRATITRTHAHNRTVEAIDDRGRPLALPAGHLDAGHLTHGYAITGHKAQGLTCDHTYTLGTETLYREWGYVAMSRGRITNQLYHSPNTTDDDGLHHHSHLDKDVPDLTNQLRRSRAEPPITPEIAQLASTWRSTRRYLASSAVQQQPQAHAERGHTCQERVAAVKRIDELQQRQARTVGPAIRRRSRTQRAELAAELRRQRDRLEQIDQALDQLDGRLGRLPSSQQITVARTQLRDLDSQLRHHSRVRIAQLATEPPSYLTAALGDSPLDGQPRARWLTTATDIEEYRLRWNVTDPRDALGIHADSIAQQNDRRRVRSLVDRTHDELRHDAPVRSIGAIRR